MRISEIHKRLLKNAVPYIEALRQTQNDNITEDDIRTTFRNGFNTNQYRALTDVVERENRTDIVIYDKNHTPKIIYELKTYFKHNELFHQSTKSSEIEKDLHKLATRKTDATGYFLFVCLKEIFEQCKSQCQLDFITDLAKQGTRYDNINALRKKVTVITKRMEETDDFYIMSFLVEKL